MLLNHTFYLSPEYRNLFESHGIHSYADVVSFTNGRPIKANDKRETIKFHLSAEEKRNTFYIKRHKVVTLKEFIASVKSFGHILSPAKVEWNNVKRLEKQGFNTMKAVGYGEKCVCFLPVESFFISAALNEATSLENLSIKHRFSHGISPTKKREIIRQIALFTRLFHNAGFNHQDYYLGHIFISDDCRNVYLIDLQRVLWHRSFTQSRWIIKDIAGLNYAVQKSWCPLTLSDRLRFLKHYLHRDRLTGADKKLIRQIQRKTRSIEKHTKNNHYKQKGLIA